MPTQHLLKSYAFSIILILSIILGGLTGYFLGKDAEYLKPLGDIFLNLILTTIVPLIFFSVSSAIARTGNISRVGKIIFYMMVVFLMTSIIASISAIIVVKLIPPAPNGLLQTFHLENTPVLNISDQLANIFTVNDFSKLLSPNNILPLIILSILIGFAVLIAGEKGRPFNNFLQSGERVFMKLFSLIMYYAPIGFFAYFASIIGQLGPHLAQNYLRIAILYYSTAIIYFIVAYSLFAYFADTKKGMGLFWGNIFLPAITSIATCSSAASIPANLTAAKNMQIPPEVYETTIPLGTIIHKDGSVIGGIFKIAFLFGLFHLPFTGPSVLVTALCISLLVGTVMGAIPSGGMLGELLILSVYGFPSSVLIAIAAISIIIDPPATLLNVTGNTVSSLLIARLTGSKSSHRSASDELL